MTTDDERREVAERLREFTKDNQWPLTVGGNSSTIRYAISDIVFGDKKYHSGVDLLDRLADLIEPSCDRDTPQKVAEEMFSKMRHSTKEEADAYDAMLKSKSVEIHPVDREALLALAEDVDGAADDSGGFEPLAGMLRDIARRIREALGVSDG